MRTETPLATRIRRRISESGPISVAEYMTLCLLDPVDGFYPTRDPLGSDGDFITAPEISQMFGECLGLWVIQCWDDLGQPEAFNLIELGPGRGSMMADMLRALSLKPECLEAAKVSLIEASAALQAVQAKMVGPSGASVSWADRLEAVNTDFPSIIIGNEFLDCLPIRQFGWGEMPSGENAWSERKVGQGEDGLRFEMEPTPISDATLSSFPDTHPSPEPGDLLEVCPAASQLIDHLAERFNAQQGRALFIDYGPSETEFGDTLQAIRAHEKVDVFSAPGRTDLTARVDFTGLIKLAENVEITAHGPMPQESFLKALGIEARAVALLRQHPDAKPKLLRQLHRLLDPQEMGVLFKAICFSASDLPSPLGFTQ